MLEIRWKKSFDASVFSCLPCTELQLAWKCGDYVGNTLLTQNNYSSFILSKDEPYHYWASFLSGRQRYLLFTDDLNVMTEAIEAYETERIELQSEITIKGIGISLVDNLKGMELLYIALSSSEVIWEEKCRYRFRPFSYAQIETIEAAYQTWVKQGSKEDLYDFDGQNFVDFSNMVLKNKRTVTTIQRTFQSGFWLLSRQSLHQNQVHLKINHIQVGNQLPECTFPNTLAVIPPPKGAGASSVPKPFIEFSMDTVQSEHTSVLQVKYAHLLIQEFAIRLDQVLINDLIGLFVTSMAVAPYAKATFEKDKEMITAQLSHKAIQTTKAQQHYYYDHLHVSPLMIHFSFSQGSAQKGASKKGDVNIQSEFLNLLLKSVGVTITELQDVVFKLAFFERKFVFYNHEQLQSEIMRHYTHQFIKQVYVLVLGLNIIGNPYGLIRDLSSGVQDLFYEPFKGAVQGPEEFAEGLATGVSSLFSHTVGGAAGAASRITSTLGKGVAVLTFDEDYQRRRQESLSQQPSTLGEGLAKSARNLGSGVLGGVTGVFTKPIEGAQKGGISGFATGVGKGLVGVVARPVSGAVDFATGTFSAVKLATGHNGQEKPIRTPRLILKDHIIRPYHSGESIGANILFQVDHGQYRKTDQFVGFAYIDEKLALIVTNQRVMLVKKQAIFGSWATEWVHLYDEINLPRRTNEGIFIELKQKKKCLFGLSFSGIKNKTVEFKDRQAADKIFEQLSHVYGELSKP